MPIRPTVPTSEVPTNKLPFPDWAKRYATELVALFDKLREACIEEEKGLADGRPQDFYFENRQLSEMRLCRGVFMIGMSTLPLPDGFIPYNCIIQSQYTEPGNWQGAYHTLFRKPGNTYENDLLACFFTSQVVFPDDESLSPGDRVNTLKKSAGSNGVPKVVTRINDQLTLVYGTRAQIALAFPKIRFTERSPRVRIP